MYTKAYIHIEIINVRPSRSSLRYLVSFRIQGQLSVYTRFIKPWIARQLEPGMNVCLPYRIKKAAPTASR